MNILTCFTFKHRIRVQMNSSSSKNVKCQWEMDLENIRNRSEQVYRFLSLLRNTNSKEVIVHNIAFNVSESDNRYISVNIAPKS